MGTLMDRKTIEPKVNEVLPISDHQHYKRAIKLLNKSNEILTFEDDPELARLVDQLHDSIDLYLSTLPEAVEFEKMCYLLAQNEYLKH